MGKPTETKRSRRFLLVVAFFLSLLVAAGAAVLELWFRLPVGEGPAGPAVSRQAFEAAWTTRPVLLVGLGDSITAGLGARDGYGYFDRLVSNPPDEWPDMEGLDLQAIFPKLQSTNLSISGSTSLHHERRQLPRIPLASSNTLGIVVITSGGNDLIHNYGRTPPREGAMFGATLDEAQPWITNYAARLERILDAVEVRFPGGCHVFLADIYDPTDGTGNARRVGLPGWPDGKQIHTAYNKIIHRAAERRQNVHLVKLHETFLGHGLTCRRFWRSCYRSDDPHYWFWINLEDPNERGYDAIRRVFLQTLIDSRDLLR